MPPEQRRKCKTHVGPWRLGRTLGKGASGRVRLAKHASTGRLAAVKIIPKAKESGDLSELGNAMPLGLEREVVIMKLIDHPNVIGLYDVWENRSELYLVVEYVEGGELFEYLVRRGRLPEDEAIRYFSQIIDATGYCHRFSICHRDLKPENILIDKNNNIKIADFGMAAIQPADSLLYTSCGSPHYAAPEIISGKPYDGSKADIWSAGIVLFALLTGFLPFDDDNLRQLLLKVKHGRFTMPKERISLEAQDFLTRILEVDPNKRITVDEIWNHPLLQKHRIWQRNLFSMGDTLPNDWKRTLSSKSEVNKEVLRNLKIIWNEKDEGILLERLLSESPNQEKLFYYLLAQYRQRQLEDYRQDDQPVKKSMKPRVRNRAILSEAGRKLARHHDGVTKEDLAVTSSYMGSHNEGSRPRNRIVSVSKRHQLVSHSTVVRNSSRIARGVLVSSAARRIVSFPRRSNHGDRLAPYSSPSPAGFPQKRSKTKVITDGESLRIEGKKWSTDENVSGPTTRRTKALRNKLDAIQPHPRLRTGYLDEVMDHLNCLVDVHPTSSHHSNSVHLEDIPSRRGVEIERSEAERSTKAHLPPPTPLKITERAKAEHRGIRPISKGMIPLDYGEDILRVTKTISPAAASKTLPVRSTATREKVRLRDIDSSPNYGTLARKRSHHKGTGITNKPTHRKFFGLFPGKVGIAATGYQTGQTWNCDRSGARSWFSKLWGIKPESSVFHFDISANRALCLVCDLLRVWKQQKYGVTEVTVTELSQSATVRIGKRNLRNFRPVSFSIEALAHGNEALNGEREERSLIMFTQIAGSASSFHKVVESLIGSLRHEHMSIDRVSS